MVQPFVITGNLVFAGDRNPLEGRVGSPVLMVISKSYIP
jgi:hypothetical protein